MRHVLLVTLLALATATALLPPAAAVSQDGIVTVSVNGLPYASSTGTLTQDTFVGRGGVCSYDWATSRWVAHGVADATWYAPRFTGPSISFDGDWGWSYTERYHGWRYSSNPTWDPPCSWLLDLAMADAEAQARAQTSTYMRPYTGPLWVTAQATSGGVAIPGTTVYLHGTATLWTTVGDPTWILGMGGASVRQGSTTLCEACGSVSGNSL
ncbi:MAG TPA: hypothetical protein VNX21_09605 [Candidatus Thermoplasmatota archaeon]|nr:hypothetical protein [Candidatus Thermoplasmatota archaeon]